MQVFEQTQNIALGAAQVHGVDLAVPIGVGGGEEVPLHLDDAQDVPLGTAQVHGVDLAVAVDVAVDDYGIAGGESFIVIVHPQDVAGGDGAVGLFTAGGGVEGGGAVLHLNGGEKILRRGGRLYAGDRLAHGVAAADRGGRGVVTGGAAILGGDDGDGVGAGLTAGGGDGDGEYVFSRLQRLGAGAHHLSAAVVFGGGDLHAGDGGVGDLARIGLDVAVKGG